MTYITMLNDVDCNLMITGPEKWLEAVETFLSEDRTSTPQNEIEREFHNDLRTLSFNKIAPYPAGVEISAEQWRLKRWGTNRSAFGVKKIKTEDSLTFKFLAVRRFAPPPAAAMEELSFLFPSLTVDLFYWSLDDLKAGSLIAHKGEIVVDSRREFYAGETIFGEPKFTYEEIAEKLEILKMLDLADEASNWESQLIQLACEIGWNPIHAKAFIAHRYQYPVALAFARPILTPIKKLSVEQFEDASKYFKWRRGLITYRTDECECRESILDNI